MRARDHSDSMLSSWLRMGVHVADLAVRRSNGVMIWHRGCDVRSLPLSWARAENASRADVYIRPARGQSWPVVLLDDVPLPVAARIARKYSSLLVQTSHDGGCHVWLQCDRVLTEAERGIAQRWLASRVGADPASTSGEHLGRVAGFRNWKRGGNWVNVLPSPVAVPQWNPQLAMTEASRERRRATVERRAGLDMSASGREWGWTCRLLEGGVAPHEAYRSLVEHARDRRGRDAERYARRTVLSATLHVGSRRRHHGEAPPLT